MVQGFVLVCFIIFYFLSVVIHFHLSPPTQPLTISISIFSDRFFPLYLRNDMVGPNTNKDTMSGEMYFNIMQSIHWLHRYRDQRVKDTKSGENKNFEIQNDAVLFWYPRNPKKKTNYALSTQEVQQYGAIRSTSTPNMFGVQITSKNPPLKTA